MADYGRLDPYRKARYDQGVDAKIVIMGNTGVGKTSLLHRYTQNKFDPKNTTSTTGAFFVTKKVYVNGIKVRLQLWDTAGQERFRSMAPMYYRGANAALLLYDITNASTFDDIRGWLEELKRNCSPDLIIYIVGSKADLHRYRQVTSDLARLSLHTWFPPPRPPTPPAPVPPPSSPFSYMRPRFTSFTSIRSVPITTSASKPFPAPSDSDGSDDPRVSVLKRNNTSAYVRPRARSGDLLSSREHTNGSAMRPSASRLRSHLDGRDRRWDEVVETNSGSMSEEEDIFDNEYPEGEEWGLDKGMDLFEVSSKDDFGVEHLFDTLITAIISRKDSIERENELKRRDSVFLSSVNAPSWAAQAEEEEEREKARQTAANSWSCCAS